MRRSKKCKEGKTRMLSINPKCMSKNSIYASRKVQKRLRQLEKSRSLVKRNKSSKRRRRSKGNGRVVKDGGIDDEVDDEIKALEKQLKDLREKKRKRKQEEVEEEKREEEKREDKTTQDFIKLYKNYREYKITDTDDALIVSKNEQGQNFLHFIASLRTPEMFIKYDDLGRNIPFWTQRVNYFIKYCAKKHKNIMNDKQSDGQTLLSLLLRTVYKNEANIECIVTLLETNTLKLDTVNHAKDVIQEEKDYVRGFGYNDKYVKKIFEAYDKIIEKLDKYSEKFIHMV
jgi:hypothetical protein